MSKRSHLKRPIKLKEQIWDPHFIAKFLGFTSLTNIWTPFYAKQFEMWPTLEDYNQIASQYYHKEQVPASCQMKFVQQQGGMTYLLEISQQHCIPTRPQLWHDFFNFLTWLKWPQLKWAIIQRLQTELIQKSDDTRRNDCENLLTHFDETGMILCTDQEDIIQAAQNFCWKSLFWQKRDLLAHCYPLVFGHGLLEKGLNPYIGMTAKAIFLKVPPPFFRLDTAARDRYVDEEMAKFVLSEGLPTHPKALQPFPLLGWPTWHPGNHLEEFYDNQDYFRGRRKIPAEFVALARYEGRSL